MCGRFGFAKDKDKIKKRFNLKKLPDDLPLLYNIAPHQNVPAILNETQDELTMVLWGLVPSWLKEEKFKLNLINAKAETIEEKPIFKNLVKNKRCLILADCFYEWKKTDNGKEPYRILLKSEELFAFAGIWDLWERDGKRIISCCIITTSPNELMAGIHDRMPVILDEAGEQDWLKGKGPQGLLGPYDPAAMKCHRISTMINSPANDSPVVIVPLLHSE